MGIVGGNRPSAYSESPRLWNDWCELTGFAGHFLAYDIPNVEMAAFLESVWKDPSFAELTVTDPYKDRAFELFKSLAAAEGSAGRTNPDQAPEPDPPPEPGRLHTGTAAARLLSANHLIRGPGGTPAYLENTDGRGLVAKLPPKLWNGARVLLVGAGGAGTSIADALPDTVASLSIADADEHRAAELARRMGSARPGFAARAIAGTELGNEAPRAGKPPERPPGRPPDQPPRQQGQPRGRQGQSRGRLPRWRTRALLEETDVLIAAIPHGSPVDPPDLDGLQGRLTVIDTRYGARAATFEAAVAAELDSYDGRFMLFGQFALAADLLCELHGIDGARHSAALSEIRSRFLGQG
jgi:shikimate 5-dehydrogenase